MDFASSDAATVEEFVTSAYGRTRFIDRGEGLRTAISRRRIGSVSIDRAEFGVQVAYEIAPMGALCVTEVLRGRTEQRFPGNGAEVFGPGGMFALQRPDLPNTGVLHRPVNTVVTFSPELLTRVAGGDGPVRLTGHLPVSAAGARQLSAALAHLRQAAEHGVVAESPLLAGSAEQYLAAAVLAAFPSTVRPPSSADRVDAHTATLRRAIAYLESHVREDVSVADIAAACGVTTRAVQLAFRRHLDTTPLGYLRTLRMAGAHEDLLAADGTASVAAIAAAWGFGHPGRFAIAYRESYGRSPSATLNS